VWSTIAEKKKWSEELSGQLTFWPVVPSNTQKKLWAAPICDETR
jgi:hypothetical protein